MLTQDVEMSLFDHIDSRSSFPPGAILWRPGEKFNERAEQWVQVRIVGIDRSNNDRYQQAFELYDVEVTCYYKTDSKASVFGRLSRLEDSARLLVDSSMRAPAAVIKSASTGEKLALMDFGAANESRQYNQDVSIGGVGVPGVDLSILSTRCTVSSI